MSMNLHGRIKKAELINEPERFDFLERVHPNNILRMDEVHPSKYDDGHYLFLIWVRPQDHQLIEGQIRKTLRKYGKPAGPTPDTDWTVKILPYTGEGLIIVSTWL